MVFLVVMYGCESWTVRNAKHWIDAFKLWCWRRFLRVPWTARRSNHWNLKEINPEYSLEGLMLKLKLHYFGHLMQRADSLEKTLLMGKIEGRRRGDDRGWAGWMPSPTQWTWVWANSGRWWRTGKPGMLLFMGSQSLTQLSDWTTKNIYIYIHILFHIIFCNGLSQDFKYSSLCYTVGPCFLSMIYLL